MQATYRQILLVRKYQEQRISQLILIQHPLQFLASLNHTLTIIAVNDKDDALGVLEIMPPQRTDLILTTDIPHGKLNVLVLNGLNVEP